MSNVLSVSTGNGGTRTSQVHWEKLIKTKVARILAAEEKKYPLYIPKLPD